MTSKGSKLGKSILKMFDTITSDKKSNATMQANAAAADLEASQESMRNNEVLQLAKMTRHGFPYKPTCIAYDLVQNLVAIGTRNGYVKIFGAETVEYTMFHFSSMNSLGSTPSSVNTTFLCGSPIVGNSGNGGGFTPSVMFMSFLVNEGALITYCDDNTLSFWNIRQRQPSLCFSKKLINERVSALHLPFQSNWIYIGTEKGNTYILNVYNNFSQSGYDIKWNNVIELSQKTKPGKVIHLSDHPLDTGKLLIGFDSGLIVLWNIKNRKSEYRFYGTSETMSSISWFYDGKQFMSSHNNGSLIVWNCRQDTKPVSILHPHMGDNDLIPQYNMVKKVHWHARPDSEQLIIFADGLPTSGCAMRDAITIIRNNKHKTIIEMKDKIIDFLVINSSPWMCDHQPPEPVALIVLLDTNMVVIDLKTEGFPQFDHHHTMGIHESPVSLCQYIVEPNGSIFRNLNELCEKSKSLRQTSQKTGNVAGATTSVPFFSQLPYPINGGIRCPKPSIFPYSELIVTGHDDGSVKIWDASGVSLRLLNKFKTYKFFDKRSRGNSTESDVEINQPFRITALNACNNMVAVAAVAGHVTLYKFYSRDFDDNELGDIPLLEIPLNYENSSADPTSSPESGQLQHQSSSVSAQSSSSSPNKKNLDYKSYLRTKVGFRRQAGYQPELVCLLLWQKQAPQVNSLLINNSAKSQHMLIIGTDEAIICVDYSLRTILINIAINELYGDLFLRNQRSPKKLNMFSKMNSISDTSASITAQYQATQDTDNNNNNSGGNNNEHNLTRQMTGIDINSRSSSNSSLENAAVSEGVKLIAIIDNTMSSPNNSGNKSSQIWLGTNYGSVVILNMLSVGNKSDHDQVDLDVIPKTEPTQITPTGIQVKLKGQILDIEFLDMNGILLTPMNSNNNQSNLNYKSHARLLESNLDDLEIDFDYGSIASNSIADNFFRGGGTASGGSIGSNNNDPQTHETTSGSSSSSNSTPTTSGFVNPFGNPPQAQTVVTNTEISETSKIESKLFRNTKKTLSIIKTGKSESTVEVGLADRQLFAVITSEHQIKVVAVPSMITVYKYSISEGTVAKASIVVLNTLSYLSCCLTNGAFLVFNLPNLKLNIQLSLTPLSLDKNFADRISRTFTFGSRGHSFYMSSPSEMQKLYLSSNSSNLNLSDMLSELFNPKKITPEKPKINIFKTIFSSSANQNQIDREELFGEASGKPSVPIMKNVESEVNRARGEMSELQKLALERGEKLSTLQMKSEQLTEAASTYAKNAHALAAKYKKKSEWF